MNTKQAPAPTPEGTDPAPAARSAAPPARSQARPAGSRPGPFYVATQRELADFFGLSLFTIRGAKWVPKRTAQGYDLQQCVAARFDALRRAGQIAPEDTGSTAGDTDTPRSLHAARLAKLQEEVAALRRENAEADQLLFAADELSRQHAIALAKVRHQLMQAPDMVSNAMPGPQKAAAKQIVAKHLQLCLAFLQDEKWLADKKLGDLLIAEADKLRAERGATKRKPKR